MADRTVKVRLEADISDFVTDIGGKAVAAVNKLERAAANADRRISTVGATNRLQDLGSKADAAGSKLSKTGSAGESAGRKISASIGKADDDLRKFAETVDRVNKAAEEQSKSIDKASKSADAHANAIGRLRTAQLRLAEAQRSGKDGSALAGAEESVKAAERAVKKFEEAGQKSGRSFGAGLKKWLTGAGSDLGKQGGTVFGSGFLGALKAPIIGPALVAILTAATLTVLPAVGAVAGGAFVTGFGAGLVGLGAVFAAQNYNVKKTWSDTLSQLGRDMQILAEPFQAVLKDIAFYFQRTVDSFNPALRKVFADLADPVDSFADNVGVALEGLVPAIAPIGDAFAKVLDDLGRGGAVADMIKSISDGLIELSNSVAANPQALGDFVRGLGDVLGTALVLITTLNNVNTSFEQMTGGLSLVDATMKTLQSTMVPLIGLFSLMDKQVGLINALTHSTEASGSSMADAASHTVELAQGMQTVQGPTKAASVALETVTDALTRQKLQFSAALTAMGQWTSNALASSNAAIAFQAAIDAASASAKENGKTLNINTEKGRANRTALNQVAEAANRQTQALDDAGASNVAVARSAEKSRANFVLLARSMGATQPQAEAMARALINIPNVTREAKLTADIHDLESKLKTAKAKLSDKKLTATQRSKLEVHIRDLELGIAAAKRQLAGVPSSKTVTITTRMVEERIIRQQTQTVTGGHAPTNANGGYYPRGMYPSYANGKLPDQATIAPGRGRGMVQWAEGETGGEAFIPLAPSKRSRSTEILGKVANEFGLGLVKSFASGGITGRGDLVDINYLLQQLSATFNPLAGINYQGTLAAANKANAAAAPYKTAAINADRAEQAAKAQVAAIQRAITLQQRAIKAEKAPKQKTKAGQAAEDRRVAAEQAKLIKLQDQLYVAKNKSTLATKASTAADAAYKVKLDAATKANEAHKASIEALIQQQKAAVDLAKQVSDSLLQGANIGDLFQQTLTGKGLLADLQDKGKDLANFASLISQLRAKTLDEDLIQQIIGKGADQGSDLAQAILAGGLSMVQALNRAQWQLEKQADLIGAGSANARFGVNVTGHRAKGGDALPGKAYVVGEEGPEILRMGMTRGWVEPNRYVTNQSSFTRSTVIEQHNTFVGVSMAEADLIASRAQAKAELALRGY